MNTLRHTRHQQCANRPHQHHTDRGDRPMMTSRLAHNMLLTLTCGVAAITFTVSFHGLNGYGLHVMHLGRLSPFVPAGVDMASLVALIATHLRRGDRFGRRVYAWAVFATTAALSVAGNLADGAARGLPPAGLVGVAAAPVVFVLVSHLAITSWQAGTLAPAVETSPAGGVQDASVTATPAPGPGRLPAPGLASTPAGACGPVVSPGLPAPARPARPSSPAPSARPTTTGAVSSPVRPPRTTPAASAGAPSGRNGAPASVGVAR